MYRGRIGIERRGQSSQRFPKQSWSIELRDRKGDNRDVALLGHAGRRRLGPLRRLQRQDADAQRRWPTRRRAGSAGYASRTRFVEVRLERPLPRRLRADGEARSSHEDRIDLPEPAQLIEWTFSCQARDKGRSFRLPVSGYFLLFEDPEREDLGRRKRRAQVRGSLGAAERALYGDGFRDPRRAGARHIDAGAAVDYVLLNELFKNQDAFHASTYLARGAGGPLAARPGVGLRHLDGQLGLRPERPLRGLDARGPRMGARLYGDPAFVAARRGALARRCAPPGCARELLRSVDRHARRLAATGAAARNFRRWPVLGVRVWPNPPAAVRRTTYASEVPRCAAGSSAGSRGWTRTWTGSDLRRGATAERCRTHA